MFIAMNRFKVKHGQEKAFEDVWKNRDTHLTGVPGFRSFALLKGPEREDHTLYSSHTVWASQSAFEGWTKSEAFRAALSSLVAMARATRVWRSQTRCRSPKRSKCRYQKRRV